MRKVKWKIAFLFLPIEVSPMGKYLAIDARVSESGGAAAMISVVVVVVDDGMMVEGDDEQFMSKDLLDCVALSPCRFSKMFRPL